MTNYSLINKSAYDSLASEYNKKCLKNILKQKLLLKPFIRLLKNRFSKKVSVLDVGCGVGINCKILEEESLECEGVDFAPEMLKYAKQNSPGSRFYEYDFLSFNSSNKYQGIIVGAFLALFPAQDLDNVIKRMRSILDDNGLVLIYMKFYPSSEEGLFAKQDYDKKVKRFIHFWKEDDLIKKIALNFNVIDIKEGYDEPSWKVIILEKIN